jgi:ATP-dependent DNA ligase
LDEQDLRRQPIEMRKELLAKLIKGSNLSLVLDETFEEDGAVIYRAACKRGCEGIVSKRLGSPYRGGRSAHWVKVKKPKASAVKREAEEDCQPYTYKWLVAFIASPLTAGLLGQE